MWTGSRGQMPAWGSSEKNQVETHLSATDACPVTVAAGAAVSTVRVKSTRWKDAAAGGMVKPWFLIGAPASSHRW